MLPSFDRTSSIREQPERTSFFDEQRHNRRSARHFAWLCYGLVAAMCLVMSVLLAPLLFALIGLSIDVLNLVVPMPNRLGVVWGVIDHAIDRLEKPGAMSRLVPLAAVGAIPGLLFLALLWHGVRTLFERVGDPRR